MYKIQYKIHGDWKFLILQYVLCISCVKHIVRTLRRKYSETKKMIYIFESKNGFRNIWLRWYTPHHALIKKKTKFSSYMRKFRWYRVQSPIWGRLHSILGNAQLFAPYMRRTLVIYDFTPDPSEFPNIWGNFLFFFISAHSLQEQRIGLQRWTTEWIESKDKSAFDESASDGSALEENALG
jgi:hypothetical protein